MASANNDDDALAMIEPTLLRLTEGLPNRELKIISSQAEECTLALEREIQLLEAALQNPTDTSSEQVNEMINSEFTPPDKCFTVSALLGRLREPMATPLAPNTTIIRHEPAPKRKQGRNTPTPAEASGKILSTLLELDNYPSYRRIHEDSSSLLAVWKRINHHKSSVVFRRAVNPKEAPGYEERILFPIDLLLIKKMILARIITSFSDLHQRIGLICHNCVNFNGRESDYAVVTREFEAFVDEIMVTTVLAAEKKRAETPEESL